MATASLTDRKIRVQLRAALTAALEKKAADAALLDVRKLADFTDYFLVCHGTSARQVQAIADAIEDVMVKKHGSKPTHLEGYRQGEWVVLDYLHFVVHVFSEKSRKFYGLERLWQKAPRLKTEEAG
ncbi:MAG: ribosome silencing factor [Terriglobales bacterium]